MNVFLYLDMDERLIATTLTRVVQVGQFACLEVAWVNSDKSALRNRFVSGESEGAGRNEVHIGKTSRAQRRTDGRRRPAG